MSEWLICTSFFFTGTISYLCIVNKGKQNPVDVQFPCFSLLVRFNQGEIYPDTHSEIWNGISFK